MKKWLLLFFLVLSSSMLLLSCSQSSSSSTEDSDTNSALILPHISTFETNPTDQFLVSMNVVADGHMYRGENADNPHSGAHVNFDNAASQWPLGGEDLPENYPAIYAIADGIVEHIDTYYAVADNYRYGVRLKIATANEGDFYFSYSIEPMIDPEDSSFYEDYLLVEEGDEVSKGDIIAYMYLTTTSNTNAHIHFNMLQSSSSGSEFIAPVIFSDSLLSDFLIQLTTGVRNYDGNQFSGTWMSDCLGYKIAASENPFSDSDNDCLK